VGSAVNCVLLLLAALGGEWIVHQIQYLLAYGNRFGWVMASTVHRYYMPEIGIGLAAAAALLIGVVATLLLLYGLRRAHLLGLIPEHVRQSRLDRWPRPRLSDLLPAALVIAWLQVAVYVAQENLETQAQGLGWPGLAVLFPAHYPVALPLHLLIALCSAFVLWTLALLLRRSHAALQAALALVALFLCPRTPARRITAGYAYIPTRRPVAGIVGLRAPPLSA
jgi:hypothetical protein